MKKLKHVSLNKIVFFSVTILVSGILLSLILGKPKSDTARKKSFIIKDKQIKTYPNPIPKNTVALTDSNQTSEAGPSSKILYHKNASSQNFSAPAKEKKHHHPHVHHNHAKGQNNEAVKVEDIPAGKFQDQFDKLSREAKKLALFNLSQMPDFTHDIASLNVDKSGMLFYTCKFEIDEKVIAAKEAERAARIAQAAPGTSKVSVPISTPPVRHSKAGATNVLFLDFNGGIVSGTAWNTSRGISSWDCKPFDIDGDDTTFSDDEQTRIIEMWAMVAEDYAPFDVDVTTEEPASFNSTTGWCMITETTDKDGKSCPHNGYGGIAYVDVFGDANYNYYSPAWVTEYSNTYVAEAASHELGHNMGLSHDGQFPGDGEYYKGHDNGVIFWNAIMGGGVTPDVSQWSKGEYYNANRTQDDLAIISGKLSYRTDDHGDTNGTASALNLNGLVIDDSGIIETTDDPDVFSFSTGAGSITINANAYKNTFFTDWGANLDINLELYDSGGSLVTSDNPTNDVDASITTTVAAGTYYIHVKPTGVGNPTNSTPTGYTSYGSLGQYTLTGNVSAGSSIEIDDVTVIEGNAGPVNAVFTVTVSGASTFPVTVDFATADNNATAGTDYVAQNNTLSFNANGTQNVTIVVNGDTLDEDNETFYVNLSNAANASITDSQGVGTITDDDPEPTLTLSVDNANIAENSGVATFTARLSAISGRDVTVDLSFSGTASGSGTDYTASGSQIVISAGNLTGTVTVTADQDTLDEDNETVIVDIASVTNGTENGTQQQTTTITDDDPPPTISIDDVTVTEGDSGTTTASFTISLSATSSKTVTVNYTSNDRTATTADNDYDTKSGTVTFTPGDTSATVSITVNGDQVDEDDETFTVDLSGETNSTIADAQGVGTITDDDTATISIDDVSVTEVDTAATSTATFTVSLACASSKTVTVDYTTNDGTATAGSDYTTTAGTLTFNPGDTSKTIPVTITGDFTDENNETFTVDLSNPTNAPIGDVQGLGTIVDEDTTYTLTVNKGTGGGSLVNGVTVTITANAANTGLQFKEWTGDTANVASTTTSSTTIVMPESDAAVTATYKIDPATAEKVAYGYDIETDASDISGMDAEFTKRPKIFGTYTDPVKNKAMTSNTKILTKISSKSPANIVDTLWTRNVYLYSKTAWKAANKAGTSTQAWLAGDASQNANLEVEVMISFTTAGGTKSTELFRGALIVPPTITSIELWDESGAAGTVHTNSVVIIKGTYFGIKAPQLSLEYTDAKGAVRQQRLKVLKPYKYADYKGTAGKSCMDLTSATGVSQVTVQMPSAWWSSWTAGAYSLILDNKIGLDAAQTITTMADGGGTAPTATNDTVTLHTGSSSYEIDVLANDTDPDSDNMTIVLGNTTSTQGGKVSVSKGKVKYAPPNGIPPANFPDTFTYSLTDGHGGTSGNATVTVNMNAITLDALKMWNGTALGASSVQPGSLLLITGTNFGIKAPTVTLAVENGVVLKLKVLTPPDYADYKGKANKSYTDVDSTSGTFGNSKMFVEMPKKAWSGYGTNSPYTLTVANKFDTTGATATIATTGTNTAPTANNDSVNITSGSAFYLIDVLADNGSGVDNDAESDKLTIVLGSKTSSTHGAKLTVDKKTNQVKYVRAAGVLCPFTDTFTYTLTDPSGATSGTATVTVNGALAP